MLAQRGERLDATALLPDTDKSGEPLRKKAVTAVLKLQNVRFRQSAIESATSNDRFAHHADDFDRDDYLLACANGVIELKTGTFRPGRREDLITLASRVEFDPTATCPRWLRFLTEVFANDDEMLAFVQAAVGYSLLGLTREEVFFILYGKGRNGKGTFLRVLLELLGNYGKNIDISALIADKSANARAPRNDVAAIAGCRFVTCQESREGAQLDEALIKALTGGDLITARFLYKECFTFRPTWKIWMATNHRPEIRGSDDGIWSRPKLIPFEVSFEGREDRGLKSALLDVRELSGILNWAVEGCQRYQEEGLCYPEAVTEATARYKADSDVIGRFIAECCVVGYGFARARPLFRAFSQWADDVGEQEMTEKAFCLRMEERGYEKKRKRDGVAYMGLGLRENVGTELNGDAE
jgi:putative DNA primase/helicase